ncbi:hypothetical protein TrRE_jg7267 [Triparma retinervis]|uniref:Uncharacterized protein n=1 Tax=Triparma retinervis TaxID=2557542 RepID=A0A9W7A3D1_9STRA|nr:hypothetical protein TrRE_jg7267 [Triparma retinervis]
MLVHPGRVRRSRCNSSPAHAKADQLGTLPGVVLADPDHGTMPSQGIAVRSTPQFNAYLGISEENVPDFAFAPAFPEFFDANEQANGFPAEWPNTARSIQNAEASICDAFIRTIFGWRPSWGAFSADDNTDFDAIIEASIWNKSTGRGGFKGTLSNVRTPFGDINLEASDTGINWEWSSKS